jgi:hypothetical protein
MAMLIMLPISSKREAIAKLQIFSDKSLYPLHRLAVAQTRAIFRGRNRDGFGYAAGLGWRTEDAIPLLGVLGPKACLVYEEFILRFSRNRITSGFG